MASLLAALLTLAGIDELSLLILIGIGGALGALLLPIFWREAQTRQRLGPIAITFDPGAPRLGETCHAKVTIRPRGPIVIESLAIRITAQERIYWKVQDSSRTQANIVYELQIPTRRPGQITPPKVVSEAFQFTIPPEGPCSFKAPQNRLEWTVSLRVVFEGSLETRRSFPLTVPPIRLVA